MGIWSAEFVVTVAGSPQYKFIVDGVFELDPLNPEHTDEGFFIEQHPARPRRGGLRHPPARPRCGGAGDIEVCAEVESCLTWTDALDPCADPAEYCADGSCRQITSPLIVGDDITFTVRDEGYAGLFLAGDFTDPAWGCRAALRPGRQPLDADDRAQAPTRTR